MRVLILILILVYVVLATRPAVKKRKFNSFKAKFAKKYKNKAEEDQRFQIYSAKLDFIEESNALFAQKKIPYELEDNDLSDLTTDEVINLKTGLNLNFRFESTARSTTRTTTRSSTRTTTRSTTRTTMGSTTTTITTSTITNLNAQAVDWRLKNVITPVKNQGYCGSCWAFAANGVIEAHMNIKSITNPNLSEQNLIDCTFSYGNRGCRGGWMTNSFRYIIINKGMNNATVYPYEARNGTCRYRNNSVAATLTNYTNIRRGDEATLENVVRDIGPVTVAVDASATFQLYKSGVLSSTACSNRTINHAVVVVGFNNTHNPPYWIIKNSWGSSWGDKGYIKIEKNKNACCVANFASYPVL